MSVSVAWICNQLNRKGQSEKSFLILTNCIKFSRKEIFSSCFHFHTRNSIISKIAHDIDRISPHFLLITPFFSFAFNRLHGSIYCENTAGAVVYEANKISRRKLQLMKQSNHAVLYALYIMWENNPALCEDFIFISTMRVCRMSFS